MLPNPLHPILLLSLIIPSALSLPSLPFNPFLYQKHQTTCQATDHRNTTDETPISLSLSYLDINPQAEKTLILLHGWPSLWTTYRNQIERFGDEYRLLIPEHRGYGDSEHPEDLEASNTMFDFVNDVQCIMDHAGVDSGVCIGNDFGAQVCWEAGRSRPDRFIGIFNVGIPYISASLGFSTNAELAALNPSFSYQVYLSNQAEAAGQELDADPRSAIRSCAQVLDSEIPDDFLRRNDSFLGAWEDFQNENNLTEIPFSGIMSKLVEEYMVREYEKQGFYNTFNGYQHQNRRLTYDFEISQGNFTLPQPTFTIFPTGDPVADWVELAEEVMAVSFLLDHHNATIPTAHWPHEELPDQFNDILEEWLGNVTFTSMKV